jgi:O-antigen ligase
MATFAAMVALGTLISPVPQLTVPKAAGLVLGFLVMRAVALTGTTCPRLWSLTWAYLGAGTATAGAALFLNPQWSYKYESLYAFSRSIPRIVEGLPGAEAGVNPNALGGTALMFLPLLAAVAGKGLPPTVADTLGPAARRLARFTIAIGYGAAGVLLVGVLVLSQSRSAWISGALVACLLLAIRLRPWALVSGVVATIALVAWLWPGPRPVVSVARADRLGVWTQALSELREHPLVGIGLGAFRDVVGPDVGHAHNIFLQVALDTGGLGLIAYLWLLWRVGRGAWRVIRLGWPDARALASGGLACLAAVHAFGMTDAIALGAKVGLFFWWNLGVLIAIANVAAEVTPAVTPTPAEEGPG